MVVNLKELKCTKWRQSTKSVIIATNESGYLLVFSTFKACIDYFELPYHSVKMEKLPFTFDVGPLSHYFTNSKFTVQRKQIYVSE